MPSLRCTYSGGGDYHYFKGGEALNVHSLYVHGRSNSLMFFYASLHYKGAEIQDVFLIILIMMMMLMVVVVFVVVDDDDDDVLRMLFDLAYAIRIMPTGCIILALTIKILLFNCRIIPEATALCHIYCKHKKKIWHMKTS